MQAQAATAIHLSTDGFVTVLQTSGLQPIGRTPTLQADTTATTSTMSVTQVNFATGDTVWTRKSQNTVGTAMAVNVITNNIVVAGVQLGNSTVHVKSMLFDDGTVLWDYSGATKRKGVANAVTFSPFGAVFIAGTAKTSGKHMHTHIVYSTYTDALLASISCLSGTSM
jgi:hypothetical protein